MRSENLIKNAIIVEDFELIAEIWQSILKEQGISVLKIFNNADGIENEIIDLAPDIVLMDINLKGEVDGIQLTTKLIELNKKIQILVLSIHKNVNYVLVAKNAGALGYINKNSSISELKKAISTVINGQQYFN